LEKHS